MKIEIKKCGIEYKATLQQLMQLYIYDFTEFLEWDVEEDGLFRESVLDAYFIDPEKTPLLVYIDDALAGFVLISSEILLKKNEGGRCIKEFFILKRHRRKGAGKAAAATVFEMFPGKWEVRVVKKNLPALAFWDAAIRDYAGGDYTREDRDDELWSGSIFSLQN